jgi:hypothetical protein
MSKFSSDDIVIAAAVRSPIGTYGGQSGYGDQGRCAP